MWKSNSFAASRERSWSFTGALDTSKYGVSSMATTKVTFTLDQATVARLRRSAERLRKSRSEIVREAIRDYGERIGKLSERERLQMLEVFDEMVPRIPPRPLAEVERELKAIRLARRGGGRRSTE